MQYYEVWVRSHRYQNQSPLTYASSARQSIGSIVIVPLQKTEVLGIVVKEVPRPAFNCKQLASPPMVLPPMPATSLDLFRWLQHYYPAPIGPLTQLFLPDTIGKQSPALVAGPPANTRPVELNTEQKNGFQTIQAGSVGTYLLHGRTGSGKTRLYAALAKATLQAGRSVLILCPEISLTPQLVNSFTELLGQPATVWHSKLTAKQRRESWLGIISTTTPQLVIGSRSALFTPLQDIGLIVIDEMHEPAYKQEQQPYYYAPRVAAKLAELHHAKLVLGSATPPVSEYYLATKKQRPIIKLANLASGAAPAVHQTIINLKDRAQLHRSPYLADSLLTAIEQALASGEQSMLYLNRRGTARISLCEQCGWQSRCLHCDIALTYHDDQHQLICHTCGRHESLPTACPTCGNTNLLFRSAGTKAIAAEVSRLFPEARVRRFDTDNTQAERFEQHYETVRRGDIDILVGTQLLAKGLDLPKLTTLGIILADSSLAIPDFTATERTYQLIQQVLGRVGRGHSAAATAIIQTYNPDSVILQSAIDGDWQSFYDREIAERRAFLFPPFCHLLKVVCRRKSSSSAQQAASKLRESLTNKFGRAITIEGPASAFQEKRGDYYHWQLVVKAPSRETLLQVIVSLPSNGCSYDIDPMNLL